MKRLPLQLALFMSCAGLPGALRAQTAEPPMPPPYRGVQVHVDGIFVTPVPGAPFTAEAEIVSHDKLPNGTEHITMTRDHIARGSSGIIRNERRRMMPGGYQGEPQLLSVHLYDPSSRTSTFFDPMTHVARLTVLPGPLRTPAAQAAPGARKERPGVTSTDLGTQMLDGVQLQGTRKVQVIPAAMSGTGQPVEVTDEYWYSPELSIFMTIRHVDPRTGEQMVVVTKVDRHEPPAGDLTVPADYRIVDETPPPPPSGTPTGAPSPQP